MNTVEAKTTQVACPKPQTKSEIAATHLTREQKALASFGTIGFDAYVSWILKTEEQMAA